MDRFHFGGIFGDTVGGVALEERFRADTGRETWMKKGLVMAAAVILLISFV